MSMAGIKKHFANRREWEVNPIVLKELRQAVRSWAVTGMLLLFLTVLFITSLAFLVGQSFDVNENMQLGGSMFSAFMVILTIASVFFIPLYAGVRVAAERQDNNPDLLYVSTLSPTCIIRGKFLCGAYMTLLFFSTCMPFMAFTNLLRGVDLPTVFFILFYLFLVVCTANQMAICLACLPASRPFKILIALAGLIALFWGVIPLILMSLEFMRSGIGAMMAKANFWFGTLTGVAVVLAVVSLFFVLSVALISPSSANRALPLRIHLTATWLLGGILSFVWVAKTGERGWMSAWTIPTFVMMMIALLVTISNSDQVSQRVRSTIPRTWWKRALAFVFFNGAAGGLLWVAAILTATFLLTRLVEREFPKSIIDPNTGGWFVTTTAYAFAYSLTALFIHRKWLLRRPPKLAGLLAVILAGAWALAPSVVLFFLNKLSWKSVDRLQLGNIFNVFSLLDDQQRTEHRYFAIAWLLVMLILNAKWLMQRVAMFQPLADNPPKILPPAST